MTISGLRFVFMGTPEVSAALLREMCGKGFSPVAVVTQEDKPRGRGYHNSSAPVKIVAEEMGIPVYQPRSWKEKVAEEWLRSQRVDFIFIAAYGHILPPSVLEIPSLGCFNVHASLLPKYRGPEPVRVALLAGESETGASIFRLEKEVDAGPVALQSGVVIDAEDDSGSLTAKIFQKAAEMFPEFFDQLVKGSLHLTSQDEALASTTRKFSNAEAEVVWRKSAAEIVRHIRAFGPEPGGYTFWGKYRCKIFRSRAADEKVDEAPGTVVRIDPGMGIGVATGGGIVWIQELQLEGKKRLSFRDFITGQRDFIPPITLGSVPPQSRY